MKKRQLLIALIICSCFSLLFAGCGKGKPKDPNAKRVTKGFNYDFVDFLDVKLYGYDGAGFLQITPKEMSVTDFPSEEEYIKVKKTVDSMALYLIPGDTSTVSYLYVDKPGGLKNGDEVTVALRDSFQGNITDVGMNVNPYVFTINGLKEPKYLDLFDDNSVTFYGLEGTEEIHYIPRYGKDIPKEVLDNINYTFTPSETTLKAGTTILHITAALNQEFLNKGNPPYYTSDIYFGKNGFNCPTETEKVLMTVVGPINFTKADKNKIAEALFKKISLESGGSEISRIASIQQLDSVAGTFDPYTYTVVFNTVNQTTPVMRATVRMVQVGSDIEILSVGGIQKTVDEATYAPLKDMKLVAEFTSQPPMEISDETDDELDNPIAAERRKAEIEAQKKAEEDAKAAQKEQAENQENTPDKPENTPNEATPSPDENADIILEQKVEDIPPQQAG